MLTELYITVDPGFDSIKVIANGIIFKFPFNAEETDERVINEYALRDDFMLYREVSGSTWRVGQYARELIFDNKNNTELESKMRDFYTEKRFISKEFLVGLRTAIALSIDKTNLYNSQHELVIYLMVALPHSSREQYCASVKGISAGNHTFSLKVGKSKEKKYNFSINENNIYTVSQTIAAILGETSDINGNINQEKFFYLSEGPTLVIDGGYYTTGLVHVSRGGSVDDRKSESNIDYSMKNINIAVADSISDKRPDIKYYVLEYMLSQNDRKVRYIEKGQAAEIDLKSIREEKIKEICNEFIKYLNNKYNKLLDFNYVLVTGGTGACFYNQLKDYYTNSLNVIDESHFILSNSEINDKSYSIEYSIAIGAYKGLKGKLLQKN